MQCLHRGGVHDLKPGGSAVNQADRQSRMLITAAERFL